MEVYLKFFIKSVRMPFFMIFGTKFSITDKLKNFVTNML